MSLLKASDILEMHLFFVNRMGVVASALAYLYIVCKNKCIDMKATMCTTSCGMSALFGRVGGWKDPSVEPRSCGSGSLPPIPPALATSTAALCTEASSLVCTSSQLFSSIFAHCLIWLVTVTGYLKRTVVGWM